MRVLLCLIFVLFAYPAAATTDVWLMYGWGDNFLGTSSGIDDIAARARTIPGVASVNVRDYWDTSTIYNEAVAAVNAGHRVVLGGYSCGLNSATVVARGLWESGHHIATVVGIQQSKWCGGNGLESNVRYGQSTYNEDCRETWGLGCKPLEPAPSFGGKIVNIHRAEHHGYADNDPLAQQDVLKAIAATSLYGSRPSLPPRPERDCRFAWTSERGAVAACQWTTRGGRMVTVVLRGNQALRVR